MARYALLLIFLSTTVLLPFVFFGEELEQLFSNAGSQALMASAGSLGWLLAIVVLIGDLVLPIPTGAVFAALGIHYGPLLGGLIGTCGSVLSGMTGYLLCRLFGRSLASKLIGPQAMSTSQTFFAQKGGWLIVFSRWLPILPEVVSCLAGLAKMPTGKFLLALICGSIPVAFTFAWFGFQGADRPLLTLLISALLPLVLWAIVQPILNRRGLAG